MTGGLQETQFTEADEGEPFERWSYDGRVRSASDEVMLRTVGVIVRRVGRIYEREESAVHTAASHGPGLVDSLVVQGLPKAGTAKAYRAPSQDPGPEGGGPASARRAPRPP